MVSQSIPKLNAALLDELRKIIDLPKAVTALELTMRVGDVPRLTYSTFVYGPDGRHIIEGTEVKQETRTFKLVDVTDDALDVSSLSDEHRVMTKTKGAEIELSIKDVQPFKTLLSSSFDTLNTTALIRH